MHWVVQGDNRYIHSRTNNSGFGTGEVATTCLAERRRAHSPTIGPALYGAWTMLQPAEMRPIVVGAFEQLATEVSTSSTYPSSKAPPPPACGGAAQRPRTLSRGGVAWPSLRRRRLSTEARAERRPARYRARFVQTPDPRPKRLRGGCIRFLQQPARRLSAQRPAHALQKRREHIGRAAAGYTLALWEGGVPHRFDPVTPQTHGRFTHDGALEAKGVLGIIGPELPFAHPSICPETGESNFGTAYGARHKPPVHTVSPSGTLTTRSLPMRELPFVHDMALTRRFAVFVLPATVFDVPATLLGLRSPVDAIEMRHAPGKAVLVPRNGGSPIELPVPPGFVFHWSGAWDDGDRVILEGISTRLPQLESIGAMFDKPEAMELKACPVRLTIDLAAKTVNHTVLADLDGAAVGGHRCRPGHRGCGRSLSCRPTRPWPASAATAARS